MGEGIVVYHPKVLGLVTGIMTQSRHAVNTISTLLESGMDKTHANVIMIQFGVLLSSP
jgi:hypothetical protein